MTRRLFVIGLAGGALVGLFGCGGGGYDTSSGIPGMEVFLSGRYDVLSKDPGILPSFYSIQITQNGKNLQGIDNLGRTWTGTMGNLTLYGAYPTGQEQTTTTQQTTQQQTTTPESYTAEIYLTTQTKAGTISVTGVVETRLQILLPTTGGQQQQQTTTELHTVIIATVVDDGGNAGAITLYNPVAIIQTTQTTP
jgi:hypothetical protein